MATLKIEIPDAQLPRIRAAYIARSVHNQLASDFDPSKMTEKDALDMLGAELRDVVRSIVASHEQAELIRAAESGVDVSDVITEPK